MPLNPPDCSSTAASQHSGYLAPGEWEPPGRESIPFAGFSPIAIPASERNPSVELEFADNLTVGSSVAVSTSLTVGYVLCVLRGGSLSTPFVSSIPAWQTFEPLPFLESFEEDFDEDGAESLESIVERS